MSTLTQKEVGSCLSDVRIIARKQFDPIHNQNSWLCISSMLIYDARCRTILHLRSRLCYCLGFGLCNIRTTILSLWPANCDISSTSRVKLPTQEFYTGKGRGGFIPA